MPAEYEPCFLCKNQAEFSCSKCDRLVCGNDVRLRVICTTCSFPKPFEYKIHHAICEAVGAIEELVTLFWGDPVQLMYDQSLTVTEHPAIVAECNEKIVGFIAYTPFKENAVLIIALGILPQFQGGGIGKALVACIEKFAREQGRQRLMVVTTNDNLPALAFYQRIGFQLYEVVPNVVAKKLGALVPGIANIPIRDELRLQKHIS